MVSEIKQRCPEIPYLIIRFFFDTLIPKLYVCMDNTCEERTFNRIFNTHSRAIFKYIYYKYGNEEKAHDAVQEAFTRLWEHCKEVLPEKARSFVYTVANNLYLNTIKAEKIRLKYASLHVSHATDVSPEYLYEENEFKVRLEKAINDLPEGQRTVFLLHRIDGKKYSEIAEMEGVSVKAIEKRMHLALKSLKELLDPS